MRRIAATVTATDSSHPRIADQPLTHWSTSPLLKRDDLLALADKIGVGLTQRREVETIRLEVWTKRTKIAADLAGALAGLSKPTLTGLCEAFELEVSSHHKDSLVATLAGFLKNPDEFEYTEAEVDEAEPADLTADEAALLRHVPDDGSCVGNGRLRRELDWKEGKYWKTRDSLVEKGYLAVGFGRGGSVYRLGDEELGEEEAEEEVREEDVPFGYDSGEESLYAPILQMLKNNWQQLFPGFPAPTKHWVDSSPRQGRRMTGGRWTRHLLVRGQAARSVQHPEASRLKVGVATFEDPTAADTWTVHVVPGRHAPEARLLNEFMETLPEPIRKEIEFSI